MPADDTQAIRTRSVRTVAVLTPDVARSLPWGSVATDVWLHPDTQHHLISRHHTAALDAARILEALPQVFAAPEYYGLMLRGDCRRVSFVRRLSDGSVAPYLHVALKYVPAFAATTRHDELWVSTAFWIGEERLRRYLKHGRLQTVF